MNVALILQDQIQRAEKQHGPITDLRKAFERVQTERMRIETARSDDIGRTLHGIGSDIERLKELTSDEIGRELLNRDMQSIAALVMDFGQVILDARGNR